MRRKPLTNASLVGEKICQCSRCKEFFSSEKSFDKHLKGTPKNRKCSKPESVGLVIKEIGDGTAWSDN